VHWGSNSYAFLETTELDIKKQKILFELFSNVDNLNSVSGIDQNRINSSKIRDSIPVDINNQTVNSDTLNQEINEIVEDVNYLFHIQDKDGYTNLRNGENGKIIRKVYPNEFFSILGSSGAYFIVQFENGTNGYIYKSRVVKK
jgi:hypothetical protein